MTTNPTYESVTLSGSGGGDGDVSLRAGTDNRSVEPGHTNVVLQAYGSDSTVIEVSGYRFNRVLGMPGEPPNAAGVELRIGEQDGVPCLLLAYAGAWWAFPGVRVGAV